jgi:lysozyme
MPLAQLAQLAPAQRAKFTLATQACDRPHALPAAPADAPAQAALADALIVPAATRTDGRSAVVEHEARHLQLFDGAGTIVVLGQPVSLASQAEPAAPAPLGKPARSAATPRSGQRALQLAPAVDEVARRHDIDPLLLHAIAHVESRHDTRATSPAGARGVMQVMPATARRFGVAAAQALQEPRTNLEVSASYLKTLQRRFGNDLMLVLAAYNAGEGAVEKYGRRVPPYAETQSYVRQVLAHYRRLSAVARQASSALRSDL